MEEKLLDAKSECGCYGLGECCYDRFGSVTHIVGEECFN